MIKEVADNGIDEAIAGTRYYGARHNARRRRHTRVEDDGRGIPVEKHQKTGVSTLETV